MIKIIINLFYLENYYYIFNKTIFIFFLFFIFLCFFSIQISYALNHESNFTKPCNCVIFRMNDIQDYWLEQGQIAVMDLFLSKNQSLTLGIQSDSIGNDSKILNKVKEGFNRSLFELAINGWNNTDYNKTSEQRQSKTLFDSNIKLLSLFSNKSKIFI